MPHYTQVPDELFDMLMSHLSGAELKVLLYIIRRTFGFKKQRDSISLSQMVSGIKTKDGEVLDKGTGLGKSSVARALNKLEEMNIIMRVRSQSRGRGDEPTSYALKMREPVSQNGTPPSAKIGHPVSRQRDTQETAEQQTEKQQAALVAALLDFGIDKPTVDRLVKSHDGQRIAQKIDYVVFMQEEQPDQVRNPRGWLLKAIEQDYGSPAGYRPRPEREALKAQVEKRQKKAQETEIKLRQVREDHMRQSQVEKEKLMAAAQESYQTTAAEADLWQAVLHHLRFLSSDVTYALIKDAQLLTTNDGTAVIGTVNPLSARWLRNHLGTDLPTIFERCGQPVEAIQVVNLTLKKPT